MTLGRCRSGLRGIPGPLVARQPKPPNTSPRDLDLPSRALESAPVSTRADASSLGIRSGYHPSADTPLSRPLPGTEAPFGPTGPTAEHVPPPWFLTTMTAYSAREIAGLLHPATDRGFAAFPDARGPYRPPQGAAGTGRQGRSPRRGSHPPKTSLADSRTASLRPLPSCRYRRCPVPEPGRSHFPVSDPEGPRPPGSDASRAPRSVVGDRSAKRRSIR